MVSLYLNVSVARCVLCRRLPPYGNFTVGLDYAFDYIIDAMKVTDNLETIVLPEAVFLSHFENLGEAVTSFSPIHSDTTVYHLYMVLRGDCSLEEIKAYAKVMNVNYLQAKRALMQKRNLIAAEVPMIYGKCSAGLSRLMCIMKSSLMHPYG